MHSFIHFTLRQKVLFNLLFVLLIVIGAFALLKMPVDRYPNIEFGKMYINTFLPGASPEDTAYFALAFFFCAGWRRLSRC